MPDQLTRGDREVLSYIRKGLDRINKLALDLMLLGYRPREANKAALQIWRREQQRERER